MNARSILNQLIKEYQSYIEPYNRPEAEFKMMLLSAGEKMCGNEDLFDRWFRTMFNTDYQNIPRDMVGKLITFFQDIINNTYGVMPKTLKWWKEVGASRFEDFNTRQYNLVWHATTGRTKFPPLMTEQEALRSILWMHPSLSPEPATQTPPEPFIHVPPLVQCLPEVQVVALLPAITDTPLVYGCDQFIRVPVEVDAAPAFAGKDNRTREVTVRVIEVEDDEIEIVFEPDEELTALIQEPVKIPSRLEHVIEMEKKLHATRKARILEIEAEVCQFFELERFAFRTTTGKFTSTVIDQQDAETLRGYLVHLESKYDSMKSRQALGDRRESRRLGKTG